jgi:hypothetical protein
MESATQRWARDGCCCQGRTSLWPLAAGLATWRDWSCYKGGQPFCYKPTRAEVAIVGGRMLQWVTGVATRGSGRARLAMEPGQATKVQSELSFCPLIY